VRTTIDLPDDLYRALKTRAAINGVTMRDLVRRLIEQGLRQPGAGQPPRGARREAPPVIIPPRGIPIPAVPRSELHRMEEQEDVERHGRSARR
jgi:hypothetical protein